MTRRHAAAVAFLFALACGRKSNAPVANKVTLEPAWKTEAFEPCRLKSGFDLQLLQYIRANVPIRSGEPNVDTSDPEHPQLLTPWLEQKRLPLTALPQMVNVGPITIPPGIDSSVSKYTAYIERGWRTFGVQPSDPAILAPPLTVDRSTLDDVRDQKARNTCVAHATLAAMERFTGGPTMPDDLSEEDAHHAFARAHSKTCCENASVVTIKAPNHLKTHGVPKESIWTYTSPPPACTVVQNCGSTLHQPLTTPAARYRIDAATLVLRQQSAASITNPAYLEALLEDHDLVVGTYIPGISKTDSEGTLDIWFDGDQPYCPSGGHALLLVGYDHNSQYFIARDSRGKTWGHGGYLYLTYRFMRVYAKYGFFITKIVEDPA